MNRFTQVAVALLAIAVVVSGSAPADGAQAGVRSVAVGGAGHSPSYMAVPGYYMLAQEHVQKEIGLTEKQKTKLQAISKKYYEQMRQGYTRQSATDWQKLSEDERKKKIEEMRKKSAEVQAKRKKTMEAFKKQVEGVLTKEQLATVKELEFKQRAGQMLRNSRVFDALGMSKKQKAQLERNNKQLTVKMRQLQKKAAEKALGVLTDEQLEKLRELHKDGYRTLWQQATPKTLSTVKPQALLKVQPKKKCADEKKPKK